MPAAASPVIWQVSNVVFDVGGTLAGTLSFDAATGAISRFELSSTAGTTIMSNRHCGSPYPPSPGNSSLWIAVANASLLRSLGFSFEGYLNNGNLPGLRNVIGPGAVAAVTSVPEPGMVALAVLALTAVAATRRRMLG
jgi:hypothetical protein